MIPANDTITMPIRKRLWVLLGLWAIRIRRRIWRGGWAGGGRELLPSRIVCFEFTRAGDIVCAGPFLSLLKRTWPASPITLVVYREVAQVPRGLDEVDEVVVISKKNPLLALRQVWRLRKADGALVLSHGINPLVALYFLITSARVFAGYLWSHTFVRLPGKPLVVQPVGRPFGHLVDQRLDIARALGLPADDAPPVHFSPRVGQIGPAVEQMLEFIARKRDAGMQIVSLAPGSRSPNRQWPLDHFTTLGRILLRDRRIIFVVYGGEKEKSVALALKEIDGPRVVDATNQTNFMEFAALLGASSLVIGNDSAGLHLAAAQRVPSVGLFGPVPPELRIHRIAGYSSTALRGSEPCHCGYDVFRDPPCPYDNACLTSLSPERVAQAAIPLLSVRQMKSPASEPRMPNAGALVQSIAGSR